MTFSVEARGPASEFGKGPTTSTVIFIASGITHNDTTNRQSHAMKEDNGEMEDKGKSEMLT